ncbi:MAG: NTP transferase domain-containing protein [Nocardioides sp.]|nr:NTP transferase domain-containing protein [Nocardioides sp.]
MTADTRADIGVQQLPFCAVVLAGGRAARLDGVDKASIEIGGRTLLAWSLDAVVDAAEVVVVGEPVPTDRAVTFTRESPRYGGPVAALLTGVDALLRTTPAVAVIAVDMPHLTPLTLRRLRQAAVGHDGSALVDHDGRRQLAMVLTTDAIARVRPDHEAQHDLALHRFLTGLDLVGVPTAGSEHRDVDTWRDLRDLRT